MVAKGAKGKGKSAPPAAKGGSGKGASEEGSEKRIRQAVYDIRYRARREDIDLKAAFSQYMSNSSLSQADRTAVREKIFGKAGGVSESNIMFKSWVKDLQEAIVNSNTPSGVPATQRLVGTDAFRKYVETMVPGSSYGKQFINKYKVRK